MLYSFICALFPFKVITASKRDNVKDSNDIPNEKCILLPAEMYKMASTTCNYTKSI